MPFVPASLVAQITREAEYLYTDTCTIERKGGVQDPADHTSGAGYTAVATAVTCRMIYTLAGKGSDNKVDVSNKKAVIQQYRLAVPIATAIEPDYRVTLDSDSSTWWVVGIDSEITDKPWKLVIVSRSADNAP